MTNLDGSKQLFVMREALSLLLEKDPDESVFVVDVSDYSRVHHVAVISALQYLADEGALRIQEGVNKIFEQDFLPAWKDVVDIAIAMKNVLQGSFRPLSLASILRTAKRDVDTKRFSKIKIQKALQLLLDLRIIENHGNSWFMGILPMRFRVYRICTRGN